jgi:hypothetical protein
MITYNLERARVALQYLVDTSYYSQHVRRIESCVAKPRALPFKDDAESLNELIIVGRQNRKALDNLLDVARSKRGNKGEYQREFMAAKRKRDRKVIHLEELLTGQSLSLEARRLLLLKQYATWNKEREQCLKEKDALEWDARNALLREFWQSKEDELDTMLTDVTTVQSSFRKKKRAVTVQANENKLATKPSKRL